MPSTSQARLRSADQIPGPPPLSLLSGFLLALRAKRDPIAYVRSLQATYGSLIRLSVRGGNSMYFAFRPEYNVLLHDNELFSAKGFAIAGPKGTSQNRLATSLFTLNGDKYKQARHELLPAFQKSALAGYRAELVPLLEKHLSEWKPGQAFDLLHEMRNWSWSIAARLLYGLDTSSASRALRHSMHAWLNRNASPLVRLVQKDWPLMPYRGLLRHAEHLEREILALMRARDASAGRGNDVLSLMMRARADSSNPIGNAEVVGHVTTLFLAAFETTANSLSWTFFLLAQHPEVLGDLLDELAPLHGAAPTLDQLSQLPLLDAVLKESMRLLPAIVISRRISTRECAFGPYRLPADSRVLFSHYITHHMPELYPEPERFLPQRWETITPAPGEYIPFGGGARYCIGSSFAQFVLKTALAMTLPRWRLTVKPNARIDRHVVVSMEPKYGIPVTADRQDRRFCVSPVRGNIHEMVDLRGAQGKMLPVHSTRRAG